MTDRGHYSDDNDTTERSATERSNTAATPDRRVSEATLGGTPASPNGLVLTSAAKRPKASPASLSMIGEDDEPDAAQAARRGGGAPVMREATVDAVQKL